MSLKLYDGICPDHGEMIYSAEQAHGNPCEKPGCTHLLTWKPSFARVAGKGWFQPGWDIGLGVNLESIDHRKRVMKEKKVFEKEGGGDVNTGEPYRG